ncbi:LapA family protein [Ramlibacter henchirensis]|jgi:lipopolysaccharide assembly protein A|uniref:LapA family protein n=1 Tax=Ramlibacter henchirensis TaxID=204072 RepID=A0A4Z0C4H9_9BURK|nr:LapA family protein [Ramlibacter henchirensis]TFZ05804.1 LapA family protein [Ramlibacter henchirensis]
MKYLMWLLKAAIFFTLFAFALNNQHAATVHFFFGQSWNGPLVLVVLAAFALGLVIGAAGMVPRWWRHRRRSRDANGDSVLTTQMPPTHGL